MRNQVRGFVLFIPICFLVAVVVFKIVDSLQDLPTLGSKPSYDCNSQEQQKEFYTYCVDELFMREFKSSPKPVAEPYESIHFAVEQAGPDCSLQYESTATGMYGVTKVVSKMPYWCLGKYKGGTAPILEPRIKQEITHYEN
ncbi:MAG: hypothetical protein A2600_10725 [Candidatus Lambdaproteobacteria bacterium RIFOXYD1_FULL_56_27]|uniref:Uncharacterized protein n=1 Tax=Candidatus Lambdaproteobacteria bacterium RIFOXYD2_FULL_56_26 TaxID=1817773 RepID=A0A1F6GV53_9PROT|nr:MAG: hypothetical protein A2426_01545 [Candidatus Lambdaproteobacteria bacterium RIFOXYC1_FULL_56_13]OGH02053.1 MAG: hypothetical protein A2557_10445 [Candidatus Lambdaproteobacteria bacterium RIFOXYD2_FULL_56_26]OGH07703.1 MAG: hypothetical protein A2600_10725 [Candidatus Lambdaproteobacteria bacterium RIFOXYD1_FULL_56_27]